MKVMIWGEGDADDGEGDEGDGEGGEGCEGDADLNDMDESGADTAGSLVMIRMRWHKWHMSSLKLSPQECWSWWGQRWRVDGLSDGTGSVHSMA